MMNVMYSRPIAMAIFLLLSPMILASTNWYNQHAYSLSHITSSIARAHKANTSLSMLTERDLSLTNHLKIFAGTERENYSRLSDGYHIHQKANALTVGIKYSM